MKSLCFGDTKVAILTVIFHAKSLGRQMAKKTVYLASCASPKCISCIFYEVPRSYLSHLMGNQNTVYHIHLLDIMSDIPLLFFALKLSTDKA